MIPVHHYYNRGLWLSFWDSAIEARAVWRVARDSNRNTQLPISRPSVFPCRVRAPPCHFLWITYGSTRSNTSRSKSQFTVIFVLALRILIAQSASIVIPHPFQHEIHFFHWPLSCRHAHQTTGKYLPLPPSLTPPQYHRSPHATLQPSTPRKRRPRGPFSRHLQDSPTDAWGKDLRPALTAAWSTCPSKKPPASPSQASHPSSTHPGTTHSTGLCLHLPSSPTSSLHHSPPPSSPRPPNATHAASAP